MLTTLNLIFMDYKEIQDLLKLVNKSQLTEVVIEQGDFKLKIKREEKGDQNVIYTSPAPTAFPQPVISATPVQPVEQEVQSTQPKAEEKAEPKAEKPASSNLYEFKSPMIGTFYRATSPDADPFVKVGDQVQKGEVVCIIEAMKLFNEIESEVEGKIVKILIEDAQPVEYDQVLFLIDTNA